MITRTALVCLVHRGALNFWLIVQKTFAPAVLHHQINNLTSTVIIKFW